jgi:tetratricopeptide (TPR) repeat protein
MKTNFIYFCTLLFGLFALTAGTFGNSGYQDVMRAERAKLDSAAQANDYLQCRNRFERMAQMYTDEWLPVYYTAYCNIQLVYMKQANALALLEDAKTTLEKLETFAGADLSEVHTLWGYYYMALIAQDGANGQKYFMQVINRYEKAISLNPDNPRPVCLLAFFKQNMPASMRSDREVAEGKEKAEALFKKEVPSPDKPCWGADYLKGIVATRNS